MIRNKKKLAKRLVDTLQHQMRLKNYLYSQEFLTLSPSVANALRHYHNAQSHLLNNLVIVCREVMNPDELKKFDLDALIR